MATNDKKKELMVKDTSGQSKWTKTKDIAVPVPGDMPGRQPSAVATAAAVGGAASQDYKPSDAVTHAQDLLKQQMAQKPGAYQSQWQEQLDDIMGQILNRKPFSYDLNGDALYQQYKDQYTQQGRMAMMDTMGRTQAMTGGYGNSYAQSVGQQAYHGYLQKLNDVVPELYQLAMDKYRMEGDALTDRYALLTQQENLDYGRHREQVADWQAEREYLSGRYDVERGYDYGHYRDGVADDQWEQSFGYQKERDKVADEQWQAQFDEAKRQYDEKYGTGGSGSSDGSSSGVGKKYDTHGYTTEQIKALQKRAGIKVDGIWGPDTEKAYKDGYRHDYSPGGDGPDNGTLPDPTETSNATKIITSHMTKHEAIQRGITEKEYNAMVIDWINHANLNDGEIRYLLQYYGLE